jgi:hypothetical protein
MMTIRAPAPRAQAISTSCCSGIERSAHLAVGARRRRGACSSSVRASAAGGPVDPAQAGRFEAQADVLRHGQVGKQRRLLVDAGDAERGRRGVEPGGRGPPTVRTPESGWWAPVTTLMSVLLPAPFSPSRACTSPAWRSKSTPRAGPARRRRTWRCREEADGFKPGGGRAQVLLPARTNLGVPVVMTNTWWITVGRGRGET